MISLEIPKEPYELALPYGIAVTVRPLTSAAMATAEAAARRRIDALERDYRERKEAGLPTSGLPELDDEAERTGLYHALLIQELAARQIVAWQGVAGKDGKEAPLTRDNVLAVMDLYPVGERFFQELTLRQVLRNVAKNAFGPSAAGTSAKGPTTAEPAGASASLAPAAAGPREDAAPTASTRS